MVLDTQSSICQRSFRRLLVSIAYEVVDVNQACSSGSVRESHYHIVKQPKGVELDSVSEAIHGITVVDSQRHGKPLQTVLHHFLTCLNQVSPTAIVGHDIRGDIQLLVNEAIRTGIHPAELAPLRRLLCTKELSIAQCRLPLPFHLQYEYPCDAVLEQMNETPPKKLSCTFKFPSLEESYANLVNPDDLPLQHNAHDARGDVERCRAVLVHLLLKQKNHWA